MEKWEALRHLNSNENWGEPERMQQYVLLSVDIIRDDLGWPFIVHCGTQGLHTYGSYHYKGLAVDGHYATKQPFINQIIAVKESLVRLCLDSIMGVGIYPVWENPGFHFDCRGSRARWGKIDDKSESYVSWEKAVEYTLRRY